MSLHHDSSAASLEAAPEYTAECLLPATPLSVRDARSMVRRELCLWGADELLDDCLLVVSELVTNAVEHGGAACALRIRGNEDLVQGELFDHGEGTPRVCDRDMDATGGRGLQIVESLTDDWGVTHLPSGGKIVWFVMGLPAPTDPLPPLPAIAPAPSRPAIAPVLQLR
ncbi:ATP-binding protein [Streptosporangium sp. NPDC050855]|uniref:ATP-binding protein n=1 Tax=Streptosporangium sp. NPDC050855 TaxID=3366194 RepID=UPI00379E910F